MPFFLPRESCAFYVLTLLHESQNKNCLYIYTVMKLEQPLHLQTPGCVVF